MFLALLCVLAVPTAQLRTFARVTTCCCPDPSHCHCPDHKQTPGDEPTMGACHRQSQDFVSPVLPAFVQPEVAMIAPAERAIALAAAPLRTPHAAPAPRRPDAPS